MNSILKSVFVCLCIVALASFVPAQTTPLAPGGVKTFPVFNPPPCDFTDQFYADNGLDSDPAAELNSEPDGRFGTFRQTGPPATGNQVNWVADSNCATNDPTRRNFRILATTAGNSDDGNSLFTNNTNETPEFISILAFIHNQSGFIGDPNAVTQTHVRTVGAIGPNGGLDNQQTNPGEDISVTPGNDVALGRTTGLNPRGISTQFIVSNFEAYGPIQQFKQSLNCPPNATAPFTSQNCTPTPTQFAANPCSLAMIQQLQNPNATTVPQPCFQVADSFVNGHTLSDVATPNIRQDWRFATNRNAMDGAPNASDNNCVNVAVDPNAPNGVGGKFCGTPPPGGIDDAAFSDSPFGYFCDDLLGMWIITYFWLTQPPQLSQIVPQPPTQAQINCNNIFQQIGNKNGFTLDGTPVVKTAFELNVELEANGCGAEAKEDFAGGDFGAAWLVCPAIPDPRNGGIAKDAFLDAVRFSNGNAIDSVLLNAFSCLQNTGKFCNESAPGQ